MRSVGAKLIAKKTAAKENAALKAGPGKQNDARAKAKGAGTRGRATGPLNRHLTYIGQLIRHAGSIGVLIHPKLSTDELKSEQQRRGRNQRPVPAMVNVEALLNGRSACN